MCGIVGLFLKRPHLEDQFGGLLAAMLVAMRDRGPDSAGFAIYGTQAPGTKLTLRATNGFDLETLGRLADATYEQRGNHVVLHLAADRSATVRETLAAMPEVTVVGEGQRMELYKDVGQPADVAARFGLAAMSGTHGVGHTRMATESAVTADGAHPFTTGLDQCLVHNGSLSNHNALRRRLLHEGMRFRTENDTEVAAAYLSWRLREGDGLADALDASLTDLDGFFTLVVTTRDGFAVLRDPVGCKPAVMAETDDWVAFGSEYRALTGLPDIEAARVWEPKPARVYAWERPG